MQTIQINNPELENFISLQYGEDKTTLVSEFLVFLKSKANFIKDKKDFNKTFKRVENGTEPLYTQEQYNEKIKNLKSKLLENS